MLKLVKVKDKTEHKKTGGRLHSYQRSPSNTYKLQEVLAGITQVCFMSVFQCNTVPLVKLNIKIAGSPQLPLFPTEGHPTKPSQHPFHMWAYSQHLAKHGLRL